MRPLRGHPQHYASWLRGAHQWARRRIGRLPTPLAEFLIFGFKQGWACLFGALMLAAIIATKFLWQPAWPLARYDALFLFATLTQAAMLAFRLETPDEAKVILLFHLVGTAMEVFKTAMGSWSYPEPSFLRIGGVPLFTGFMYASVGSYMARALRLFDMRFTHYPPFPWTVAAGGRHLRQLLHAPLPVRHALRSVRGRLRHLRPDAHLFHDRRRAALDAAAARRFPDVDLPLDRRECRNADRHVALSDAVAVGLAARDLAQDGRLVPAPDHLLRARDAGPPSACAGRSGRPPGPRFRGRRS